MLRWRLRFDSCLYRDIFGTKQLGAIHGYILTAWAAAGLVGPFISSTVYEATQSYTLTLYIFAGMFVVALLISLLIRVDIKKINREAKNEENSELAMEN